jgi:cell division protein ZipA
MEFDFRLLLVVAGVGLIGYVAWDSWRNRARNHYKFKLETSLPPEAPERPDRSGFNQDGVGRPRVRGYGDTNDGEPSSALTRERAPSGDDELLSADAVATAKPRSTPRASAVHEPVEPRFDESFDDVTQPPASTVNRGVTPDLFGNDDVSPVRTSSRREPRTERPARKPEPDVIALMVLASEGQMFRGTDLVPCMLEHDLRFGEMDIFHRHADAGGQGPILFSVANALKPGTFDPNNLMDFASAGISMFMQLPGPQDPRAAYNLMLATAEQIAQDMGGEVRDAARRPLSTEVRLRHQELLAEYERQLFAGV